MSAHPGSAWAKAKAKEAKHDEIAVKRLNMLKEQLTKMKKEKAAVSSSSSKTPPVEVRTCLETQIRQCGSAQQLKELEEQIGMAMGRPDGPAGFAGCQHGTSQTAAKCHQHMQEDLEARQ